MPKVFDVGTGTFQDLPDDWLQTSQANNQGFIDRGRASMAAHNRLVNVGKIAAGLGLGGAAASALPAIGGAGLASQTGGAGLGFGGAPILGAGKGVSSALNLGSLLNLAGPIANVFGAVSGQRAQTRAMTAAQLEQQREFDQQIAMAREAEATRKAEADRAAAEAKAQWDAQQKFQGDTFRAQEEQRLHDRQLADAAEARRAPRRAVAQQAYLRLADLLHLGGQ